jgi:hypothetical protein
MTTVAKGAPARLDRQNRTLTGSSPLSPRSQSHGRLAREGGSRCQHEAPSTKEFPNPGLLRLRLRTEATNEVAVGGEQSQGFQIATINPTLTVQLSSRNR